MSPLAALDGNAASAVEPRARPPLSVYLHLPWCVSKCPYCDFNSHALREPAPEARYVQALLDDLEHEIATLDEDRTVETVFIGGGTPSLFAPESIGRLITGIRARLPLHQSAEITMEANPGTVEQARFGAFRAAGVNRLSVGVQSFDDGCLERLGRIHGGREARRAVERAQAAGFDNLNIDLMFALPEQTAAMCLADVRSATDLAPSHISFYQLTLEPNTAFHARPPQLPGEETAWRMQGDGHAHLAKRGYTQYEVSAFARPGWRCLHNMNYWTLGDYLGIGAGAHGKHTDAAGGRIVRRRKVTQPRAYMAQASDGALAGQRELSRDDALFELMLNGLRLTDGFDLELLRERMQLPVDAFEPALTRAIETGLVTHTAGRVAPTELGARFLDDTVACFVP